MTVDLQEQMILPLMQGDPEAVMTLLVPTMNEQQLQLFPAQPLGSNKLKKYLNKNNNKNFLKETQIIQI